MAPRLVLQFLGLPQVKLEDKPIATNRRKEHRRTDKAQEQTTHKNQT